MTEFVDATEEDITTVQEIAEKTWWAAYSEILPAEQIRYMLDTIYGKEAMMKAMSDGTQQFIFIKNGSGYQGFAAYGDRPGDPMVCKLHKLYVLPENQGRGYGIALINEVKKRLAARGIRTLDLNVNRHNKAKRFYESAGFCVIREEDIPVGPYWMNDYVMRLNF